MANASPGAELTAMGVWMDAQKERHRSRSRADVLLLAQVCGESVKADTTPTPLVQFSFLGKKEGNEAK